MPGVTLKSGCSGTDGKEEAITEYLCDWPDGCGEVATEVVGVIRELRAMCALCSEHYKLFIAPKNK
jgi:hypothetical protein